MIYNCFDTSKITPNKYNKKKFRKLSHKQSISFDNLTEWPTI